jgi:hypothetical protein
MRAGAAVLLLCGPGCADPQITEGAIKPWIGLADGWRKVVFSKHLYLHGCFNRGEFYPTRRTFGAEIRGQGTGK